MTAITDPVSPPQDDTSLKQRPAAEPIGAVRPMRVLFFFAYPQRMAGADRTQFNLITNLPPEVEPVVVITGEGEVAQAYRDADIEVHVIPPGPALSTYGKALLRYSAWQILKVVFTEYLPYTLRLRDFIRRQRVDLIATNEPRATILIGPAAKLTGRPVVSHVRGDIPFSGRMKAVYEYFPAHFIPCTNTTGESLSSQAQKASTTVYDGMRDMSDRGRPVPWLEALRAEGVVVVSCFATVCPFKGYHHLLNAVAELNRRGWRDKAVFMCLGDLDSEYPEYVEWLLGLQQRLGLDNVVFTGWTRDPYSFYRSADVTVLPSVPYERLDMDGTVMEVYGSEGGPITHFEAMFYGLPIVGTDNSGVKEQIVNGVTGFVVPPSDPMALAERLEQLLATSDLRLRMGQAGRERVMSAFSLRTYVGGVMRVYEDVLERTV